MPLMFGERVRHVIPPESSARDAAVVVARRPKFRSNREVTGMSFVNQAASSRPPAREAAPSVEYCQARAGSPSTSSPMSDAPGASRLTPVHRRLAPNCG